MARVDINRGRTVLEQREIERLVLGSLILENDLIHTWIQDINPDIFFSSECRQTCSVILELYRVGEAIDIITVTQKARELKKEVLESLEVSTVPL